MKTLHRFLPAALAASLVAGGLPTLALADTVVLYDQDFEAPVGFNNDGGDVSIFRSVNDHYSGQPAGFEFAQTFTVETLNISGSERDGGTAAFGTGWTDDGTAGDFAIGMLSTGQADLLGLSFDVGDRDFLNFGIDITSIDLSTFGGPFVPIGAVPIFQFTLFDNPSGGLAVAGNNVVLDQVQLTGTASDRDATDWTRGTFGLSTEGNTNGNVTFQIDLLVGGYGAFDNLLITASDEEGDLGAQVPLPAGLPMLLAGLAALGAIRRRSTP